MPHSELKISKIKLPNDENIYEICDSYAIHEDELVECTEEDILSLFEESE